MTVKEIIDDLKANPRTWIWDYTGTEVSKGNIIVRIQDEEIIELAISAYALWPMNLVKLTSVQKKQLYQAFTIAKKLKQKDKDSRLLEQATLETPTVKLKITKPTLRERIYNFFNKFKF